MKLMLGALALFLLLQNSAIGKKHKMKTKVMSRNHNIQNDGLLVVEPIPPETVQGECTCTCCQPEKQALKPRKCINDVVVAVDSSACFRDYHGRMMRFLKKLVRRISRAKTIQYGGDETRLALMQFSSDILFPLELSSFSNYTNPSTNKELTSGITDKLSELPFLGEGAFLNKALNASVTQLEENPRPKEFLKDVSSSRRVVIVMTNGKSHPTVTMDDIEYSIQDLKSADVTVLPVSVTGECHGVQSDVWSNEGLCPDPVVMNKLAKVGRPNSATFMEMTSHDTLADIINVLEACHTNPDTAASTGDVCNNCTCSCELPVGPPGPPGPPGQQGDFVEGEVGAKGEPGPKGEIGDKGVIGLKGDKGIDGITGPVGPKGNAGRNGTKGDKGGEGDKGEVGLKGEDGNPGENGTKGDKGVIGEKGGTGSKGTIGDPGTEGEKGEEGKKGVKGTVGPKGAKGMGEKGIKGMVGKSGEKGMSGSNGSDGAEGEKGRQGLCGKPGPAGRPGDEGLAGVDGNDGKEGPPGREGRRGEPGVSGDKGEKGGFGAPGVPGSVGLTGERGPEGPSGKRGAKGIKGEPSNEPGVPGIPGDEGKKGDSGLNGRDGSTGPEGPSGRQGSRGVKGEKGKSGEVDLEQLRPIIVDIIRELLPGDCAEPRPTTTTASTTTTTTTTTTAATTTTEPAPPSTTEPAPPPTNAPKCHEAITDLAIVVDGSTSVKREGYAKLRNFVYSFVNDFTNIGEDALRIAIVQYSDVAKLRIVIDFDQSVNKQAVLTAIDNTMTTRSWTGGNTYTGHALNVTLGLFNDRTESRKRDAKQVAVVITDGVSHDTVTIPAENLKKEGATIFAVGIGNEVNQETSTVLSDIASAPSSSHVFFVNDFDVLPAIKSEVLDEICIKAGGVTSDGEKETDEDTGGAFSGDDSF